MKKMNSLVRGLIAGIFCCFSANLVTAQVLKMDMVVVDGGSFKMGCPKCTAMDSRPVHNVTLSTFSIGKYEVTQQQWVTVMGKNPSNHTDCDQCPVENVSYDDIQEFIKKLNLINPGKNYRLPTEAEWEYAASGGVKTHGYSYSGGNNIKDLAWYREDSKNESHPVGGKQPNELGIYDMSGNVREWCSDFYDARYYKHSAAKNPKGADTGKYIVYRGGSFSEGPNSCFTTARFNEYPGSRSFFTGFRLVAN